MLRDPQRIVDLRTSRDLSQRQAARELKISSGHMADIETRRRNPSWEVGEAIAGFYGVKLDYLFELVPPPERAA